MAMYRVLHLLFPLFLVATSAYAERQPTVVRFFHKLSETAWIGKGQRGEYLQIEGEGRWVFKDVKKAKLSLKNTTDYTFTNGHWFGTLQSAATLPLSYKFRD